MEECWRGDGWVVQPCSGPQFLLISVVFSEGAVPIQVRFRSGLGLVQVLQ